MSRPSHLAVIAAVALTALAGLSSCDRTPGETPTAVSSVKIGGPFNLVDQKGRPVSQNDLLGKPTVMFFGFTYCPEVCPTTLAAITLWMEHLGKDADKLNVVYVTVDPERDTPEQMALYLSSFDPRIRGLTGTTA